MAEEITYEEQINGGDPKDPLGLRKKVKAKPDPLGLRSKITVPQEYKVSISQPTFQQRPAVGVREFSMERDLAKPEVVEMAIGGQVKKIYPAVQKAKEKAKAAQEKITQELLQNDDVLERIVRQDRYDTEVRKQMDAAVQQPLSDMPSVQAAQLQIDPRIEASIKPQDIPVTSQDILSEKIKMSQDPLRARNILEKIAEYKPEKKNEIQSSIYNMDVANSLADDDLSGRRVTKIENNIKELEKGNLLYDWRQGRLFKPENIPQSFVTAWKAKNKAYSDYEKFRRVENNEAIAMELDARLQDADPDEPLPVPAGVLSGVASTLGGTPAKVIGAGAIGSLVGPEGAIAASSGVSALESYKLGWASAFERAYYELRQNGMDGFQAVEQARKLADQQATTDAAVGAVSGAIGARIGMRSIPRAAITDGFRKSVVNSLKGAGAVISPAIKEGLLAGGIAGAGEKYKNELAKEAGLDIDTDENVLKAVEDNLLVSLAFGALLGIGKKATATAQKYIKRGLSKMNEGVLDTNINQAVQEGIITEDQANQVKTEIAEFKKQDSLIPENISEEARNKIASEIQKRDALELKMEALHKSFHPGIKEQIKAIDERIAELSKEKAPKPDKAVADLKQFIDAELDEGIVKGFTAEVLRSADPDDLPVFMQNIAEQAQDPNSEAVTRDTYGDAIVDRAIEMYPVKQPETAKKSSITVIRPEERTQPTETITIKPKPDAISKPSAEEVYVRETPVDSGEMGAGIPPPEEPTGARIEEEGQIASEEGQAIGDPLMSGITHAKMDEMSRRLGFPEYEKGPETQKQWNEQAAKRIADSPNAIPELLNKMRNGHLPTPVEQKMMGIYVADLEAKLEKDPFNNGIITALKRAKDLSNIAGGRFVGQSLVARQGLRPVEETLGDFYEQQQQASGIDNLTQKQKETNLKEFEEIKAAEKAFAEKEKKTRAQQEDTEAQAELDKVKKTTTKQPKKDYKKERADIIAQMRADLLKVAKGGEGAMSSIPGLAQLKAVAPHVAKLVKNLVEEGIDKLPDVIDAVHEQLKDIIEGISKDDVRALIAGKYNEKRRPRSEITAKIRDLKDEATLIGKLQQLEAGVEPKSEQKRIERTLEIEDLKKKIKEHHLTDLAAAKRRMTKEIQDLEKMLATGEYAKEERKETKLDREGQQLKDQLIRLRKKREIRLAEDELAKRPTWRKVVDYGLVPFRELRTLWSSFDYSMPGRQGIVPTAAELLTNPGRTAARFRDMFKASGSEKFFDRYMYDLKNSPDYKVMEDSGLAITEPGKFDKKEEVFQSRYLEKIPYFGTIGIKGSERAAAFWLNNQRVGLFMEGVRRMQENGRTFENSPEVYKNWASAVNSLTGRGELIGPMKNAGELLSTVFFSPKLMASRLAFFNPKFYAKMPKELRWKMARDMAKFIGLGVAVLSLGKMFGADADPDPRGADFGKLKIGDTRYDIWGGLSQYVRLFVNAFPFIGQKKTSGGAITNTWDKNSKGERAADDVVTTFLRSKSSPLLGTIWDITAGENIIGQDVTVKTELKKLMPLIWKDMIDGAAEEGVTGIVKNIPAIFGVGTMTYKKEEKKSKGPKGKGPKRAQKKNTKKNVTKQH